MAIENTYLLGKNITLGCGFDLQAKAPLDSRQTVPAFAGLQALIDGNAAYEGMIVYDEETKKTYQAQIVDGVLAFREFGINEAELKDLIASETTAAMEFKGAATALPENPAKGDMYKVTASFKVGEEDVNVGDSIVYDGTQWFVIPSGDDIEDTWRPVTGVDNDSTLTFAAGDKLEKTVAADGTITYKHVAIDAPTNMNEEGDEQTRTYITQLIADNHGHIIGFKTATENVEDTNTTYEFEGLPVGEDESAPSSVYFQVKSSEEESAEVIYLDAYNKNEADAELAKKLDKSVYETYIEGKLSDEELKKYADDAVAALDSELGDLAKVDTITSEKVTDFDNAVLNVTITNPAMHDDEVTLRGLIDYIDNEITGSINNISVNGKNPEGDCITLYANDIYVADNSALISDTITGALEEISSVTLNNKNIVNIVNDGEYAWHLEARDLDSDVKAVIATEGYAKDADLGALAKLDTVSTDKIDNFDNAVVSAMEANQDYVNLNGDVADLKATTINGETLSGDVVLTTDHLASPNGTDGETLTTFLGNLADNKMDATANGANIALNGSDKNSDGELITIAEAIESVEDYVGTFTHATAKTVIEYINAKTDGIATSGNLEALGARVTSNESKITALETESAKHALKTEVEAVDAKFADYTKTTDLPTDLGDFTNNAGYAKTADVNTELDKKADKTQVATDIANAIAPLATTEALNGVDAKFANYTNTTDMNTKFDLKADKTQVATDIANAIAPLATTEALNGVKEIAEAARTESEVDGQIDAKIAALNLATTYEPIGAETRAKAYADGLITEANLDQYTTEQEVKDIVDGVIKTATSKETLDSLVELVEYIDTHSGDAINMATAIGVLEGKVETIEKKPAYEITSKQISDWDGEVGAKALAETKLDASAFTEYSNAHASDYTNKQIDDAIDADVKAAIDAEVLRANGAYDAKGAAADAQAAAEATAAGALATARTEITTEIGTAKSGAEAKAAELDAALKTELQGEIDADVKVVNDALEGYKTSNDAAVALKANAADVYTKEQTYTQAEVDALISAAHTWGEF